MSLEYDLCSKRRTEASRAGAPCQRRFEVDIATDPAAVDDVWRELETTGHCSPFQTRAWLKPWFDTLAPQFGATPVLMVVREGANGRPIMLLPLCRRSEGGASVIEFADLGVSDYNAPILAPGLSLCEFEIAALRAQVLAALPGGDLLRFDKIPLDVDGVSNPVGACVPGRRMNLSSWDVALPATREAFDRESLGASFAKELRRKARRIRGRGDVRFVEATDESEKRRVLETLCAQRAARFAELGRHDILGTPAFRRFYEQAILAPDSVCRLFALTVDGEIAATMLGLDRHKRFHLIMSTIGGEKWKSSSPGNVAMDELASLLIADRYSYLDFTIGDEPYKRNFGASEREMRSGLSALSWRGSPHVAIDCAKSYARDKVGALSTILARPAGLEGLRDRP